MKINEAYENFDVQTMERLLEVDPMLRMAKRALAEMGEDRIFGLKVLYRTYIMGETENPLTLPS